DWLDRNRTPLGRFRTPRRPRHASTGRTFRGEKRAGRTCEHPGLEGDYGMPFAVPCRRRPSFGLPGGGTMLVLTRKPGDKVLVGEHLTITVVAVHRGRVRLALDAPHHLSILRAELTARRRRVRESDPELAVKPSEWKDAVPCTDS